MTNDEYRYMLDLKGLDDIHNGMLEPSVAVKEPAATRDRCLYNGWVFQKRGESIIGGFKYPAVYLSTKGLRALQREAQRRQMVRDCSARRGF